MSQRECAGFNWPPSHIPAEEPVSISPESVKRAGPFARDAIPLRLTVAFVPFFRRPVGDGIDCDPSAFPAVGVGHPASQATLPSSALIGTLLHCAPSL